MTTEVKGALVIITLGATAFGLWQESWMAAAFAWCFLAAVWSE
jgi:hypothetical protein